MQNKESGFAAVISHKGHAAAMRLRGWTQYRQAGKMVEMLT